MDKVTVHTRSGALELEGREVLRYSIDYPQMAGIGASQSLSHYHLTQAVAFERQIKGRYFRQATHQLAALEPYGGFAALEITASVQVMHHTPGLLSFFTDTWYQLGQQGTRLARSARTVRSDTGRALTLPELFARGYDFRTPLFKSLRAQIAREAELNPGSYFADWSSLVPKNVGNRSFYLTDDGLVIFFGEQVIAEKSAGLPSFRVPYSLFDGELHFGLH